jgi:hypothetical protein
MLNTFSGREIIVDPHTVCLNSREVYLTEIAMGITRRVTNLLLHLALHARYRVYTTRHTRTWPDEM